MTDKPFMPKATAVWLVENTKISFKQIAAFCDLHELEVKGIADGDVAKGIKAYNPILAGQLTRDEIEILLERYIKKRKVKYTDDGRIRNLRADPRVASGEDFIKVNPDEIWVTFYDVEGELLYELLPELPDFENSDELKTKIKKLKNS